MTTTAEKLFIVALCLLLPACIVKQEPVTCVCECARDTTTDDRSAKPRVSPWWRGQKVTIREGTSCPEPWWRLCEDEEKRWRDE